VVALDSGPMEARDRRANLGLFAASGIAWVVVGWVVLTLDPRTDPVNGFVGGAAIGAAVGLMTAPLFWLAAFSRQRRIAYRGDWRRALRRGAWVAMLVAVLVVLRVQGLFQLPIAAFLVAVAVIAEATISNQG